MSNFIYISSVTTTGTGVILVPSTPIASLYNLLTAKLVIKCGLTATANLPVYIQTTLGNIPLLDKYGNNVFAHQLRTRYAYCLGYGNENTAFTEGQFVVFNRLCYNTRNTTTATTTTVVEPVAEPIVVNAVKKV